MELYLSKTRRGEKYKPLLTFLVLLGKSYGKQKHEENT